MNEFAEALKSSTVEMLVKQAKELGYLLHNMEHETYLGCLSGNEKNMAIGAERITEIKAKLEMICNEAKTR